MLRATLLSSHLIRALGFPDGSVWAFLMFRHDMERFETIHNVDGDGISLVDWLYLLVHTLLSPFCRPILNV
jgi:hypothetical protein